MEKFFQNSVETKEKEPKHFNAVVVSPGYENNDHRTGLLWDTRFRLLGAAALFEAGRADRIVVGGRVINEMKRPFAELMKEELIKRGIPENMIDTEQYTFDTSSQIDWISQNKDKYENNLGFITDPAQAGHAQALIDGFDIKKDVTVLSIEEIVKEMANNEHYLSFFEKLHSLPFWLKWRMREKVLETFVKYFDPKGEKSGAMATKKRL